MQDPVNFGLLLQLFSNRASLCSRSLQLPLATLSMAWAPAGMAPW